MAVQAEPHPENLCLPYSGSQEWIEIGGIYDFYHSLEQHQQKQLQSFVINSQVSSSSSDHLLPMAILHSYKTQVEMQRQEIEQLIALQNERLRATLEEQRRQQLIILTSSLESRALSLLRQKEEDIAKAIQKTTELEDFLKRIEIENKMWQRIAKENEAKAFALANTLELMRENTEDAESCCNFSNDFLSFKQEREAERRKMSCRRCSSRYSCVIFLPCRHLCSCKSCEALIDSCPVCKCAKEASIEVSM